MLLLTEAMQLAARDRTDEGLTRLNEVTTITGGTAGPRRELMTTAATATVRAAAGDRTTLAAALARIDEQLADASLPAGPRTTLTQLADLLRRLPTQPATAPVDAGRPVDDVDGAIAELRQLPEDSPLRAGRAAAIVTAFVWGEPMDDPRKLRPLDELLRIADGAVPETAQWVGPARRPTCRA